MMSETSPAMTPSATQTAAAATKKTLILIALMMKIVLQAKRDSTPFKTCFINSPMTAPAWIVSNSLESASIARLLTMNSAFLKLFHSSLILRANLTRKSLLTNSSSALTDSLSRKMFPEPAFLDASEILRAPRTLMITLLELLSLKLKRIWKRREPLLGLSE